MMLSKFEKLTFLFSLILFMTRSSPCKNQQYLDQGNCYNCLQNCGSCLNNVSCLTCKTGSYLANNICLNCSVSNCETCPGNVCSSCKNNVNLIKNECLEKYTQNTNQIILLSVSMISCFIVGLIGFGLISHFCCKKKNNRITSEINMNSIEVIEKPKASEPAIIDFNWKSIEEGNKIVNKNKCPICLDNRTNVQLQCQHGFHLQCIGTWFEKKNNCPLCKKDNLDKGTLYCTECLRYYLNVNVRGLAIIKQSKIICTSCELNNQNGKISESILNKQLPKNES